MIAAVVVVDLDEVEHGTSGIIAIGEVTTPCRFVFPRAEEARGTCIVVAVPLAAHAWDDPMGIEQPLIAGVTVQDRCALIEDLLEGRRTLRSGVR